MTNDTPVSKRIELSYHSDDLDILQVAVLNQSLHDLLNQVAVTLVFEENKIKDKKHEPRVLDTIPQTFSRQDVLIRARLTGVRQGSIIFDLQPFIAAVASNPHCIAILQNLTANVIWAIMTYGESVEGIRIKSAKRPKEPANLPKVTAKRRLSTKVQNLLKEIKESGHGGRIKIKSDDEELEIELYPPK